MEAERLNIELLKRVFGNLGAVAGPNFGKFGITTEEYIHDKPIKFEESGRLHEYKIYVAEISIQSLYKIILTNLGSVEEPEFIAVLNNNDVTFGFSLSDSASFVMYHENKWTPISLLHRLNLTAAIEMITQEGIRWVPSSPSDDIMYNLLLSLLAQYEA